VSAWADLASSGAQLFTSDAVLGETVTLFARTFGNRAAADLGRLLLTSSALTVLRRTTVDDSSALDDLERFHDSGVGFTDCTSFVIMRRAGIRLAFSIDRRHFGMAGFEIFPA